jgi:LytS/YehU family sensor histidine kinase
MIFATQVVAMDKHISWTEALRYSYGGWMTWVPFSLCLYVVVQRHPIVRGGIVRAIAIQAAAVCSVVLLKALYVRQSNSIFDWYEQLPPFLEILTASAQHNFMLAWAVIGVAHAFVYSKMSRRREKIIADMEKNLVRAQLDALKAQMNPHFLFNSLNSVAEMMHKDVDLADEMLVSLAALLRDGMGSNETQQRTLRAEVELANHYLIMEKIRLGERLRVQWAIEEDCQDALVPVLILQPLVENAIIHGISRRRNPGTLTVRARGSGGGLKVSVENSIGPDQGSDRGNGMALRSMQDRLRMLYGPNASLWRGKIEEDRYIVEISIPLERHELAAGIRV